MGLFLVVFGVAAVILFIVLCKLPESVYELSPLRSICRLGVGLETAPLSNRSVQGNVW